MKRIIGKIVGAIKAFERSRHLVTLIRAIGKAVSAFARALDEAWDDTADERRLIHEAWDDLTDDDDDQAQPVDTDPQASVTDAEPDGADAPEAAA